MPAATGIGLVAAVALAIATTGEAGARTTVRAASERALAGATPEETLERQEKLHARLAARAPRGAKTKGIRLALTEEEKASIADVPSGPGPVRIGVVKTLGKAAGLDVGAETTDEDGSFVWATTIASEDAGGIRVHLANVSLPAGAELYFYGGEGEAYGPYTGRGPDGDGAFWTPSVFSESSVLMLTAPGEVRGTPFLIDAVGHIGGKFAGKIEQHGEGSCGRAQCILDASCHGDPAVEDARDAVAEIEWISGPWLYSCSGGLLADTVTSSQIPYFLTANHCISNGKQATSVEAFFFYRTASCEGPCPVNHSGAVKTVGATVKATGSAADFTLLQLKQSPPLGVAFLGWDNAPVAFSSGADLYRISNPGFGPQVFSHHRVDTSAVTCTGWPRGQRIYSADIEGATDGGSSGSPVLNSAGLVVGQLSGCCGYACSDVCDSELNSTVDGALASYWSSVQPFLDPPPCSPAGTPCTANSACCSNQCAGKKGSKICK